MKIVLTQNEVSIDIPGTLPVMKVRNAEKYIYSEGSSGENNIGVDSSLHQVKKGNY